MLYSFFVGIYCFRIVTYYYICFDITIFDSFHRYWVYIFEINPGVEVVAARSVRAPSFPGALAPCAPSWVGREWRVGAHNQTSTYVVNSLSLTRLHTIQYSISIQECAIPTPNLTPPLRRGDGIIKIFDIVYYIIMSIIDSLSTIIAIL